VVWDVLGLLTARRGRPAGLTPEKLNALWADLAESNAARAYQAEQVLIGAGERGVQLLKRQLRPVPVVDAGHIERLLAGLDSDEFAARDKASRELAALGDRAEPRLRKVLARKPSAEVRRRAERLLLAWSAGRRRGVRAVEVLEHIGTGGAKKLLKGLAKGAPDSYLTREAGAALERLTRRPVR
jgi:hypothetical protein